jgi:hypothetical protein
MTKPDERHVTQFEKGAASDWDKAREVKSAKLKVERKGSSI